jgi:hypothetical protein
MRSALISMFLFGVALFVMTTDLILSKNQRMILITLGRAYFHDSRERKPTLVSEAAAIRRIPWFETGWGHVEFRKQALWIEAADHRGNLWNNDKQAASGKLVMVVDANAGR